MKNINDIKIEDLTLEEKIGQMIGLAFAGGEYSPELAMQIEDIQAGLIIYFKDNCVNPKQIFNLNKKINERAKIAPFIALDQEGGMVARVTSEVVQSPGAMAITAGSSVQDAYQLAYNMGKELRMIGFNFNFAPDGDINNNPGNPVINVRSYSEIPEIVADYAASAVKGYSDAGMMTSVKHFPGHGDTSVDSHIGLPVVDFEIDRLNKVELVPFKKVIDLDLPGIMASHVMFSKFDQEYPTTLSKNIIQGLLRDQMGFKGLVVTDSLTMKAVWGRYDMETIVEKGFNCGNDILLLCGARDIASQKEFYETAVRLAKEGRISIQTIDAAVERILKYKKMFNCGQMANNYDDIKDSLNNENSVRFAQEVANRSITEVKNDGLVLPIKKEDKTLVVFPIIKVVTLVENDDNSLNCLADYLPFKVEKAYMSIDPDEESSKELLEKANSYDKIIYCSYNANFNPSQAKLINDLAKINNKLAVVAVRTPYDLNVLNVGTYLCSYEASVQSFIALAKVLTGEIKATGKLPVTLNK